MNDSIFTLLEAEFGKNRVQTNRDISAYLTLKTPCVAEFFLEVESRKELEKVGRLKMKGDIPVFLLGGGSNLAITHSNLRGLTVRNMYSERKVVVEDSESADLFVSSGYPVSRLINENSQDGYAGLEMHLGLPGTVGGAIYMNSKWTHPLSYFGDSLLKASIITKDGLTKEVDRDYFQFGYDQSILQKTGEILLDVTFRLKKESPDILKKRAKEALEYRKETQPFGVATSGCFFQNISEEDRQKYSLPTTSAGYLIDKAGFKNFSVGDFVVSDKHANFIINKGKGNPKDLKSLLSVIKTKVKEVYSISLVEEVVII
jgi:UDP-N-acetylenolpyruvoylglucosamine reductase